MREMRRERERERERMRVKVRDKEFMLGWGKLGQRKHHQSIYTGVIWRGKYTYDVLLMSISSMIQNRKTIMSIEWRIWISFA